MPALGVAGSILLIVIVLVDAFEAVQAARSVLEFVRPALDSPIACALGPAPDYQLRGFALGPGNPSQHRPRTRPPAELFLLERRNLLHPRSGRHHAPIVPGPTADRGGSRVGFRVSGYRDRLPAGALPDIFPAGGQHLAA